MWRRVLPQGRWYLAMSTCCVGLSLTHTHAHTRTHTCTHPHTHTQSTPVARDPPSAQRFPLFSTAQKFPSRHLQSLSYILKLPPLSSGISGVSFDVHIRETFEASAPARPRACAGVSNLRCGGGSLDQYGDQAGIPAPEASLYLVYFRPGQIDTGDHTLIVITGRVSGLTHSRVRLTLGSVCDSVVPVQVHLLCPV